MIVVVGPRSPDAAETRDAATTNSLSQATSSWAKALTGTAAVSTTVVVGGADDETDAVSALRTAKTVPNKVEHAQEHVIE